MIGSPRENPAQHTPASVSLLCYNPLPRGSSPNAQRPAPCKAWSRRLARSKELLPAQELSGPRGGQSFAGQLHCQVPAWTRLGATYGKASNKLDQHRLCLQGVWTGFLFSFVTIRRERGGRDGGCAPISLLPCWGGCLPRCALGRGQLGRVGEQPVCHTHHCPAQRHGTLSPFPSLSLSPLGYHMGRGLVNLQGPFQGKRSLVPV